SKSKSFIPGFKPVSPTVWSYIPNCEFSNISTSTSTLYFLNTPAHPSLILLFPWTGAQPRHIQKYTSAYQTLFPTSLIVVVTTSIKDLCFRSSRIKQRRLQPLICYLTSTFLESKTKNGSILLHCFSEGGSNKATEFADLFYRERRARLLVTTLCLDSTPGHPRYRQLCNAFAYSLPRHRIVRFPGLIVGGFVLGGFWIIYKLFKGQEKNIISKTRRRFEDKEVWGIGDEREVRVYLYSEADRLIKWVDVKEHAESARRDGVEVYEVRFRDSGHCGHIRGEQADGYWYGIVRTWE
ncbi:hypothetical protein GQ43DRAFT_350175, partial [Delitschia confertaspora ATCC 74209]